MKRTTKFDPVDNEDVINKAYLDKKLSKTQDHISYCEKDYSDFDYNTTNNLLKKF